MSESKNRSPTELRAGSIATKRRLLWAFLIMMLCTVCTGLPTLVGMGYLTVFPVVGCLSCFLFLVLSVVATVGYKLMDRMDAAVPKRPFSNHQEPQRVGGTKVWSRFIIREYIDN